MSAGVTAYETLLGRRASAVETHDGIRTAIIATANIAVELMAPDGDGAGAQRLRAALETGEGLKSLVLATDDLARAHRRCERVGLAPAAIAEREKWRSYRLDTAKTCGVRLFILERNEVAEPAPGETLGLDHIVIRTGDANGAAALYGARLGLDMRLDRNLAGRRLMFFRCGDAIVEVVQDVSSAGGDDQLWGLSWRVADAEAARTRLAEAGVDVSEVRAGVKPGTRVFTVRDRTCGVPTLMIEASRRD